MLVRTWSGTTRTEDADGYLEVLRATGAREARATPGNRGVWIFRRALDDDRSEVVFISFWDDEAAVRAFAGDDPTRAVFYPDDDRFLVTRDLQVTHYALALAEPAIAPPSAG